jgi:predicted outer membrane protein
MPISRSTLGTVFVGGALSVTLAALAYPSMLGVQNVSTNPARVIANTQWGPLTEADRNFVVFVRSAGLWEGPSGDLAMKKGTTAAVREAGRHLVIGHAALDTSCRNIAPELNITIPNQPTPQQQGFLATFQSDTGKQFDTDFANTLRITHGSIFNTIAKIRSTTKNTLVRALADQANDVVLDHITQMEKTGLVNFDQVNFQETTPPKLPASQVTPPVPQPGAPMVALTVPSGLPTDGVPTGPAEPAATPSPSASPTTG